MSVIKKWFPSKYLAADDIDPNEVVTVKEIKDEAVGQTQEIKPVLYLREYDKGVILNSTNAHAIADAFGADNPYKDWPGKQLMLFTENVRNPQTRVVAPAIRMVAVLPSPKGKQVAADVTATVSDDAPDITESEDPGYGVDDEVAA